jgi:glycine/D-amino acid oxidase-like deaminating enzyme
VVPRDAPFLIWADPIGELPGGVHVRPVDLAAGRELFVVWTYHTEPCAPLWPPEFDPRYGETCIRGLAAMLPGFAAYLGRAAAGRVDGGYYCKTRDHRPLIGPLPVEGAYVLGALSGYGIMAAQAAADLVAAQVTQDALPEYASAFLPSRYDDAAYIADIAHWDREGGQL